MKLRSASGDELELTVVGYQFPQDAGDNWLEVLVTASINGRPWKTVDPSLETWDVEALIDAFRLTARGDSSPKDLQFTEPNLRFVISDLRPDAAKLRVYFELESRPPWAEARVVLAEDLWVEFECTRSEFADLANDLRQQLRRFPVRGDLR